MGVQAPPAFAAMTTTAPRNRRVSAQQHGASRHSRKLVSTPCAVRSMTAACYMLHNMERTAARQHQDDAQVCRGINMAPCHDGQQHRSTLQYREPGISPSNSLRVQLPLLPNIMPAHCSSPTCIWAEFLQQRHLQSARGKDIHNCLATWSHKVSYFRLPKWRMPATWPAPRCCCWCNC